MGTALKKHPWDTSFVKNERFVLFRNLDRRVLASKGAIQELLLFLGRTARKTFADLVHPPDEFLVTLEAMGFQNDDADDGEVLHENLLRHP